MKIIFLDCDGELTYSDYENESTANIDLEKVKNIYSNSDSKKVRKCSVCGKVLNSNEIGKCKGCLKI